MNKRKNMIFIICLALLVSLSIGYSIFSENISVIGTSTSQGTFDITATCTVGVTDVLANAGADSSNGYNNDTCSVSGNSVTFSVNLEYPTAERFFTVVLTNNGSIPALFRINEAKKTSGSIVKYNSSGTAIQSYNMSTDSTNYNTYSDLYGTLARRLNPYFTTAAGATSLYSSCPSFVKDSSGTKYAKLNKGDKITLYYRAQWPNGTLNDEEYIYSSSDGSYWKATATFTHPFYQYTKGMTDCANSSCN